MARRADATTAGPASGMDTTPNTLAAAILTIPETAPYLRKTPRTLWNWLQAGTFPIKPVEINGRPYVRVVDLEAFLGCKLDQLQAAS